MHCQSINFGTPIVYRNCVNAWTNVSTFISDTILKNTVLVTAQVNNVKYAFLFVFLAVAHTGHVKSILTTAKASASVMRSAGEGTVPSDIGLAFSSRHAMHLLLFFIFFSSAELSRSSNAPASARECHALPRAVVYDVLQLSAASKSGRLSVAQRGTFLQGNYRRTELFLLPKVFHCYQNKTKQKRKTRREKSLIGKYGGSFVAS